MAVGCGVSPLIKLGIGAVLVGVGFVVSMQGQRELIAKWAGPCEDCDDEELAKLEEVKDLIEEKPEATE